MHDEPDGEHNELAWLTARTLYGDLGAHVTDDDARAAEELSLSLRTRLRQAQPLQVRAVGFLSKSSLLKPYTEEVPTVHVPTPLASARRALVSVPARSVRLARRVLRRPSAATTPTPSSSTSCRRSGSCSRFARASSA